MQSGNFYFISDDYFKKFKGNKLMPNKDEDEFSKHGRPCYYAFKEKDSDIVWMIPISSQLDKFEKLYEDRCKIYNPYDGIRFGYVLGKKKAFLVQNMCPVTASYITNEYIDNSTNTPVTVKPDTASGLNAVARKAVRLYRRGTKIVFADILEIERVLLAELETQNVSEEAAAKRGT